MSLKCAVQLGIPDIIYNHAKPITLSELVKALSIPKIRSPYVYRLMRILVHSGFFAIETIHKHLEEKEKEEEGYMLTPSSRLLLKNNVTNLSPFLLLITDPVVVTPFHFMSTLFQGTSGSLPFEAAHGVNIWDYCVKHPEFGKILNDAMASDAQFVMSVVIQDCKMMFEGTKSLLDVGGGTGTAAKAISEAFPNMKCTVFDLPHVVSNIKGSENIKFVAGDMFESIPSADMIMLKWILHNWSDEECVKILKKCRKAIPSKDKGGKVIIIDIVILAEKGKYEATESQLCFDILMMVNVTGRERTETEWEKLFLEAGFASYKITHVLGLRSIIEVFP
ncbi:Myricetin o-methyltransferase [Thalictrum thalictroides]|uniref:Myricetin o-methyltransferase n=1 Tax=Thalictrum thalictroides TaxID=46969 RepID=A0A7J6V9G4_THATH|nr:Myricetin o-methyltransferase [Thalictrum thalictroides]